MQFELSVKYENQSFKILHRKIMNFNEKSEKWYTVNSRIPHKQSLMVCDISTVMKRELLMHKIKFAK